MKDYVGNDRPAVFRYVSSITKMGLQVNLPGSIQEDRFRDIP